MPIDMPRDKAGNKRRNKEGHYYIIILAIVLFIALLIINSQIHSLLWDETVYLSNARSHISQSYFQEDFRYPPLEYMIAGLWSVFGESILVAKISMILLSVGSVIILFYIARRYMDLKYSLLLCILYSISPLILYWSLRVYTDIPSLFFMLLSLFLIIKAEESTNIHRRILFMIFAGISAGLAFLFRFILGIFMGSVILYYLYKSLVHDRAKKHKTKMTWIFIAEYYRILLLFIVSVLLILLPWLIYNQVNYHDSIWDFKEQYNVVDRYASSEPISQQLNNVYIYAGPVAILLSLFGIYAFRKQKYSGIIYLYFFLTIFYLLFLAKIKDARYIISFLPFLYLFAIYAIYHISGIKKLYTRILKSIMIMAMIIFTIVMIYHMIFNIGAIKCDNENSIMRSIEYMKQNISNDHLTINSNAWPWYGYYLNANVSSSWDNNITLLIDIYHPQYVIYTDIIGLTYDKSTLDKSPDLVLEKEFDGLCRDKTYLYKVVTWN